MNGTSAKKHCGDGPVTIGTHDGTFHCDEVLACWMLKQLPQYKEAEIVRTRDPAKLSTCEIVVDVGAVYDADALRFDHHQRYALCCDWGGSVYSNRKSFSLHPQ